ncbi:MAG: hypothetical protein ABI759_01955 [Candidatus Solibacter sp.]
MLLASMWVLPVARAEVCDPNGFRGAYGFSLSGESTMGGTTRPVVSLGRLVLDGSGNLQGVASASFMGFFLGNPVTGKYEARSDCSVTWTLQDGSGGFQHFAGTMNAEGNRVAFRQNDPGGPGNGILLRTKDTCSGFSLAGSFELTVSGSTVNITTGTGAGRVSLHALLTADGRNRILASGPDETPEPVGSYEVQDDCFMKLVVGLPAGQPQTTEMHFRAILVDDGREVLGMQTDPGTIVALWLISSSFRTSTSTPIAENWDPRSGTASSAHRSALRRRIRIASCMAGSMPSFDDPTAETGREGVTIRLD